MGIFQAWAFTPQMPNGEIRISGITGTIVVKETKTIDGYTIDPATQMQTVTVNPEDTQTLTFYNDPSAVWRSSRWMRTNRQSVWPMPPLRSAGWMTSLVDTVTTDENGRVFLPLEDGAYYGVEIHAPEGFKLDDTPHYFEVKNGENHDPDRIQPCNLRHPHPQNGQYHRGRTLRCLFHPE